MRDIKLNNENRTKVNTLVVSVRSFEKYKHFIFLYIHLQTYIRHFCKIETNSETTLPNIHICMYYDKQCHVYVITF